MVNSLSVCLDLICFQLINKKNPHSYFTVNVSTYFIGCVISKIRNVTSCAFMILFTTMAPQHNPEMLS